MERHSRMEVLGPLHDHRYRRCRFHSPHPIRRTQSGQTDFTHRCGCEQPARGAGLPLRHPDAMCKPTIARHLGKV